MLASFYNRMAKMGTNFNGDMGATEAMSTIPSVWYEKRPVTVLLNGEQTETNDFAVVRSAFPDKPEDKERILGFVKKGYQILHPDEICQVFDEKIGVPVDTMGWTGNGKDLFITWKLPDLMVTTKRGNDQIALRGMMSSG